MTGERSKKKALHIHGQDMAFIVHIFSNKKQTSGEHSVNLLNAKSIAEACVNIVVRTAEDV